MATLKIKLPKTKQLRAGSSNLHSILNTHDVLMFENIRAITVCDLLLSVFDVGLFVLVFQLASSRNLLAIITQSTCYLSNSQELDNPRTKIQKKEGERSHFPGVSTSLLLHRGNTNS